MSNPGDMDLLQYQVVAARRLQWDNLLWQVPVLSLTAQAFLMTIILAADTGKIARLACCALSIVVTVICIQLMHRHRLSELTDSEWLADWERQFAAPITHGREFKSNRDERLLKGIHDGMPLEGVRQRITKWRSFTVWVVGLAVFGLTSLAVGLITAIQFLVELRR